MRTKYTHNAAATKLSQSGFRYDATDPTTGREYWKRTDGKPDVFLDHSATITPIGNAWLISDFVNDVFE